MLFIPFSGPESISKSSLLLFIGSDTPSWVEIKQAFKDWSSDNVVAPALVVLADRKSAASLRQSMSESECIEAREVIGALCKLWLFSYTGSGHIYHVEDDDRRLQVDGTSEILVPAVRSHISSEVTAGNVVAAAPPGFFFAKLSGRHSSHFIRTESLLSCTAAIELLALRLLAPFREYCDRLVDSKVRVLVDSMSIWPLAQALISMRREHNPKSRYVIESFRSYEGLSDGIVDSGPAFVIISASTSGGLERLVYERLGTRHVECCTLLLLEPNGSHADQSAMSSSSLFQVPRALKGAPALEGLRPNFEPDVPEIPPGCESVKIIGERFLNQNFRPRPVRLAHGALDEGRKLTLAALAKDHVVRSGRRRPLGGFYWSLSFDVGALVDKYCLDGQSDGCLLRNWLTNYAVAGDIAVVYPVDTLEGGRAGQGEAERMTKRIRELLLEKSPEADIRVFDGLQLDRPSNETKHFLSKAGVVVASPIIGNGFAFKQISAALRTLQPKGPRLFLALAALPESQARLQELRNDLQLNADDCAYHFKCSLQLPVGKGDIDFDWAEESTILGHVLDECDDADIIAPPALKDRLNLFREGNGLTDRHTFLPSFDGSSLQMSPGFLLWKTKTALSGDDLGAGVLLTVSVFLEACRSGAAKDGDTSLVSGLFQQTLISPANFTRFNDPAIQAALLRAAYKSELNFASRSDLSADMQRLILRLMDLHDAPAGQALPEFMLALAMRRVTLMPEHMHNVRERAKSLPGWLSVLASEMDE